MFVSKEVDETVLDSENPDRNNSTLTLPIKQYPDDENVDVETMLRHAGDFGRYQILLMVLFSLVNVLSAFHYFAQTFITTQPNDFRCDDNHTLGNAENSTFFGGFEIIHRDFGLNQVGKAFWDSILTSIIWFHDIFWLSLFCFYDRRDLRARISAKDTIYTCLRS